MRKESLSLRFLYHTLPGRLLLRLLILPPVSAFCGRLLETRLSRLLIPGFVRRNGIDLSEYEPSGYGCFNDFFCRRVLAEKRPCDPEPSHLIAPCDGLLSTYALQKNTVIAVKQSAFTLEELLRDRELAGEFEDGLCLVFRLCVDNYHRYCFPVSGNCSGSRKLSGVLHTVRPIALREEKVFCENSREYTVTDTAAFGRVLQMEVGAMLVGRISNTFTPGPVTRGEEKGTFLYGGSTVILLLQKGKVQLTRSGEDIPVRQGECLGEAASQTQTMY